MKKLAIVFTLSVILFFGTFSSATAAVNSHANENSDHASILVPDRYIVVLKDDFSPQDVAKGHGLSPQFIYKKALNAFLVTTSPVNIEKLKEDPRVEYVTQDKIVEIATQELPTGMDRINLDTNAIVQIDGNDDGLTRAKIAILDTGVDLDHPDLNIDPELGMECYIEYILGIIPQLVCYYGGGFGDDVHFHGTHVAGIAAAKDNGIGVIGAAPGATIVPVRVLEADGSGYLSKVLAGIDYVTLNAGEIDVANMSLRTSFDQAFNDAVAASVSAGVVYVVAAGNEMMNVKDVSPASEDSAITVSAIADFDGVEGGLNHQTVKFWKDKEHTELLCTEYTDDSVACFSNFGEKVDIAAPGVHILSTVPPGNCEECSTGYRLASGTSMASPHVAGAAALIRSQDFSMSTEEVRTALLNMAASQNSIEGFTEDNDGFPEPLLMLGETPPPNPIPVADAGSDQNVNEQVPVSLDGSNSYDPEDEPITYLWSQTAGPDVVLNDPTLVYPSFTSPTVFAPTNLVFSLVVNDGLSDSPADYVTVSVANNLLSTIVEITNPSYGETIEGKVTVSAYVEDLFGTLSFSLIDSDSVEHFLGNADSFNQVSFHTKNYKPGDYWITANVDGTEYDRILVTIPSKGGGSGGNDSGPDCTAKPNHPKCQ